MFTFHPLHHLHLHEPVPDFHEKFNPLFANFATEFQNTAGK